MAGRPTPTQDELNRIKLGEHPEFSDDGSGPDPHAAANKETQERHAGVVRKEGGATQQTAARVTSKPPGT
jgi:hypothetical protein